MDNLEMLIVAEASRVIEIIKNGKAINKNTYPNPNKAELKAKMAELRRDTLNLEKELYSPLGYLPFEDK